MEERKTCPLCEKQCDLTSPGCGKGRRYTSQGAAPGGYHRVEYENASDDQKLMHNLRHTGHVLRNYSEDRSSQKRILIMLRNAGTMPQSQLTRELHVHSASSSEILTKMEESGLIQRTASETDHRTMDVSLTSSGLLDAETAMQQMETAQSEMFDCFSSEEKKTLITLLERLNQHWSERYQRKHHGGRHSHGDDCKRKYHEHRHPHSSEHHSHRLHHEQ